MRISDDQGRACGAFYASSAGQPGLCAEHQHYPPMLCGPEFTSSSARCRAIAAGFWTGGATLGHWTGFDPNSPIAIGSHRVWQLEYRCQLALKRLRACAEQAAQAVPVNSPGRRPPVSRHVPRDGQRDATLKKKPLMPHRN